MSVLPNKYVPIDYSIVGISSMLLHEMESNETISSLWDKISSNPKVRTFDRFADALSFLFAGGLIDLNGGVIVRRDRGDA